MSTSDAVILTLTPSNKNSASSAPVLTIAPQTDETSACSPSAPGNASTITPLTNRTSPAGTSGYEPARFFLNRVPLPVRERPVRSVPRRLYIASYALTSDEHLAFIKVKNSKKPKCPQGKVNAAQKAGRIKNQFKNGSATNFVASSPIPRPKPKDKHKCTKDTVHFLVPLVV